MVGDNKPMSNGRFYGLSRRNLEDLIRNHYNKIKENNTEDWAIARYQKDIYRYNYLYIETSDVFTDQNPIIDPLFPSNIITTEASFTNI